MPDIYITKILIIEKNLFKILQFKMPKIELNIIHKNKATISFGIKIL